MQPRASHPPVRRSHFAGPASCFSGGGWKIRWSGGSTSVASPLFLVISRPTMVVVSMRRPRGQDEGLRRCDLSHAERRLFHSQTGGVLPLRSFCNPWGGQYPPTPRGGPGRRASSRPPPKQDPEQGGASVTLQGPSVAGCRQGGQRNAPHRIAPLLPVWRRWPTADGDLRPPPAG